MEEFWRFYEGIAKLEKFSRLYPAANFTAQPNDIN